MSAVPLERTCSASASMSASCHKRTLRPLPGIGTLNPEIRLLKRCRPDAGEVGVEAGSRLLLWLRQKIDRDRFISGPDIAIFIAYQNGKVGIPLELRNRSTFDV